YKIIMNFNEIYREPDSSLTYALKRIVCEINKNNTILIKTRIYYEYNLFIINSYRQPRSKRYSISQLGEYFREHIIQTDKIEYLIIRYIDGMYLLAQLDNEEQGFVP
ncbi:hypothetical protein, partial [Lactobacillus iners]